MAYDFTALDEGTWTFEVYDDPYDCDAVQEHDFNGTLGDALEWARTIAGEGYEVTWRVGKTRVNASVAAMTPEAKRDNYDNNTLLKSLR